MDGTQKGNEGMEQNLNEEQMELGLVLVLAGGDAANRAIISGRYDGVTDDHRKAISKAVAKRIIALITENRGIEEAVECIRGFAEASIRVVLGLPAHMN